MGKGADLVLARRGRCRGWIHPQITPKVLVSPRCRPGREEGLGEPGLVRPRASSPPGLAVVPER